MRMCAAHWKALREEIEVKRGLARFVPTSDGCDISITPGELPPSTGNPLIDAHNMILSRALQFFPYIVKAKPDGSEFCPLCEVDDRECYCSQCRGTKNIGGAENWIAGCGEDIAEFWRERAAQPEVVQ